MIGSSLIVTTGGTPHLLGYPALICLLFPRKGSRG
jgi:hypothetical protein